MKGPAENPSLRRFAAEASVVGGLIGAGEAAALLSFDAQLTTSRPGAALFILEGFALYGLAAFAAAFLAAVLLRTGLGKNIFGARVGGATFAASAALLFYLGFYANEKLLPAKSHPLSLSLDAVLLVAAGLALRYTPPLRITFRRGGVAVAALGITFLTVALVTAGPRRRLPPPAVEASPGTPNLLLITMDTTRADRLGAYGGPPGLTPNLDRLATGGYVAARAYCPMPQTGPSHAALLTGRTPRENGVTQNGVLLPPAAVTLAETLRTRGYRTAAVVAAFPVSSKLGFAQGFEYYDDYFSTSAALTRLTLARLAGTFGLVNTKARLQRRADDVTARAIRQLDEFAGRPFFLWVHYFDPHTPYEPPAAFRDATPAEEAAPVRRYNGEVAFMDAEVGALLAALKEKSLRDNTVIVATADHGESLGEHNYFYDHGRYVYEPSMRIPLVIAGPPGIVPPADKGTTPGAAAAKPVSNTSLYDYLLENLAPTDAPPEARRGEKASLASEAVFGESREGELNHRMVVTRVRRGGPLYKFILDARAGTTQLYDLDADPGETENLVATRPEVARALGQRLAAYFAAQPPLPGAPALDAATKEKLRALGYIN